jgi:hypothetical protein
MPGLCRLGAGNLVVDGIERGEPFDLNYPVNVRGSDASRLLAVGAAPC